MKGAVVHDAFLIRGGGERLVITLAAAFGADIVTSHWSAATSYDRTDFNGKIIEIGGHRAPPGLLNLTMARAFRRRTAFLADYDWVVYSGDFAPFAVLQRPRGGNIYYCHSPPRLFYDQADYLRGRMPLPVRPLARLLVAWMRRRYPGLLARMDCVVANSHNVRRRIEGCWHRSALVVYPPVRPAAVAKVKQHEPFFLSTARLEPLKRVDVVIRAFRALPQCRLVVASGGSQYEHLRELAADAPNIRFTGWLAEEELKQLLHSCLATVYIPRDEDFGMSPVESMAAGKPVIGAAEGGLLESVIDGETGFLLAEPEPENLAAAVRNLTPERAYAMGPACRRRAAMFGEEPFLRRMAEIINGCTGTSAL